MALIKNALIHIDPLGASHAILDNIQGYKGINIEKLTTVMI
jgi:hypothetical protein